MAEELVHQLVGRLTTAHLVAHSGVLSFGLDLKQRTSVGPNTCQCQPLIGSALMWLPNFADNIFGEPCENLAWLSSVT